jgi:hypothetical protein
MDEKTRKKLLALEYAVALATLVAISLTAWKTRITLQEASKTK